VSALDLVCFCGRSAASGDASPPLCADHEREAIEIERRILARAEALTSRLCEAKTVVARVPWVPASAPFEVPEDVEATTVIESAVDDEAYHDLAWRDFLDVVNEEG
jgi:hypothetical protein